MTKTLKDLKGIMDMCLLVPHDVNMAVGQEPTSVTFLGMNQAPYSFVNSILKRLKLGLRWGTGVLIHFQNGVLLAHGR